MRPVMRCAQVGLLLAATVWSADAGSADPPGTAPSLPAAPPQPNERSAQAYDPSLKLVSHEGKALRFYEDLVRGKVALINTMFTSCPSICPPITANLLRVQALLKHRLPREVIMVSITVDPDNDTPAVLTKYRARHGIGNGWTFLTGPQQAVDAVLAKLGDRDPDKNRHSGMLLLGDDNTRRWTRIPAMTDPAEIAAAVEKLLTARRSPPKP